MMMRRLRQWINDQARAQAEERREKGVTNRNHHHTPNQGWSAEDDGLSEQMKKKDRDNAMRGAARRRVRGGRPAPPQPVASGSGNDRTDPLAFDLGDLNTDMVLCVMSLHAAKS